MNTVKPDFLPQHAIWHSENSPEQLATTIAQAIAEKLCNALEQQERASLAVSGGRTPTAMFIALSQQTLPWERVDITLVDERWVDETHPASNAALIRQHLLQNASSVANFVPLYTGADNHEAGALQCHSNLQTIKQPIDVMLLGMGNDGHTASLFPNCSNLQAAMDATQTSLCYATNAPTEPTQRMTLTARQIHLAKHKILHLVGDDKLVTLAEAMTIRSVNKMPIFAFLQRPIEIFWSTQS